MTTPGEPPVDLPARARELRNSLDVGTNSEELDDLENAIAATATKYPAGGYVWSALIYTGWAAAIYGSHRAFKGRAWGIAVPGGGTLFGEIYSDDLDRLYRDTKSFTFTAAAAYTAIYFFDENSQYLGSFQGGSISNVIGTGGGSGEFEYVDDEEEFLSQVAEEERGAPSP